MPRSHLVHGYTLKHGWSLVCIVGGRKSYTHSPCLDTNPYYSLWTPRRVVNQYVCTRCYSVHLVFREYRFGEDWTALAMNWNGRNVYLLINTTLFRLRYTYLIESQGAAQTDGKGLYRKKRNCPHTFLKTLIMLDCGKNPNLPALIPLVGSLRGPLYPTFKLCNAFCSNLSSVSTNCFLNHGHDRCQRLHSWYTSDNVIILWFSYLLLRSRSHVVTKFGIKSGKSGLFNVIKDTK